MVFGCHFFSSASVGHYNTTHFFTKKYVLIYCSVIIGQREGMAGDWNERENEIFRFIETLG